jgi:molybdopterin converting factor small subunit
VVITVRYYAAACAAAGLESETLQVPDGAALSTVLEALSSGERTAASEPGSAPLAEVLRRCSFLVNEVAAKDRSRPLVDGDLVDVLPPFAGG